MYVMVKQPRSVRLDDDVMERVRAAAARRKWTPSFWMAQAIEAELEREEAPSPRPYDGTQRQGDVARIAGQAVRLTAADDSSAYRLVVSGRPQAHRWQVVEANGGVVAEGGPVLTPGAARRKAIEALDAQLGAGNYRLRE